MSSNEKRRKWILSLGFSEAEADSFIEFEVPKRKIEALAEVLHKPEPQTEPVKPDKIPDGMFWCAKHQTLHKLTSSVGKKCLRRIQADEAEAKAKAEAEQEPGDATEEPETETSQKG